HTLKHTNMSTHTHAHSLSCRHIDTGAHTQTCGHKHTHQQSPSDQQNNYAGYTHTHTHTHTDTDTDTDKHTSLLQKVYRDGRLVRRRVWRQTELFRRAFRLREVIREEVAVALLEVPHRVSCKHTHPSTRLHTNTH